MPGLSIILVLAPVHALICDTNQRLSGISWAFAGAYIAIGNAGFSDEFATPLIDNFEQPGAKLTYAALRYSMENGDKLVSARAITLSVWRENLRYALSCAWD